MNVPAEYCDVVSPDGTRLCVRTGGVEGGLPIVFLHGFSQSHLSWTRQFSGPLAREFRLIAFDLRGHGWSDKPADVAAYREARRWSADLRCVLDALDVVKPVLVGWSFAGGVICDFLADNGADSLAGINFVAAFIGGADDCYGPDIGLVGKSATQTPGAGIEATRRFLRACFVEPPAQDDFEVMLAYNAMVPPKVRSMLLGRAIDATAAFRALKIPVLFTHGSDDRIISTKMSEFGVRAIRGARLSTYDGVGHSPFYEAPERFDRELGDFVRACAR